MFVGVIFYSFAVGVMTSFATSRHDKNEMLEKQLDALNKFSIDVELDPKIHLEIKSYMKNNAMNLYSNIDEAALIENLPSTLKSDIQLHQYGRLIENAKILHYLYLEQQEIVWNLVKYL